MQVVDGVYRIDASCMGAWLSLYLVHGSRWCLIDSGIASSPQQQIFPYLRSLGVPLSDLELVVNTHGHFDHFGGNGAIKTANPNTKFAIHCIDRGWAENYLRHYYQMYLSAFPGVWDPDEAFRDLLLEWCGTEVAIDIVLTGDSIIDLGDGVQLRVIEAPTHSPGHVLLHDERRSLLFVGDVIQGRGTPVEGGPQAFPYYDSLDAYRNNLQMIRNLSPEIVLTAHKDVLRGDEIERELMEAEIFCDELHEMVTQSVARRGDVSLSEVVDDIHAQWPQYDRALQIFGTCNSHLDTLSAEGSLTTTVENGIKYWHTTGGM